MKLRHHIIFILCLLVFMNVQLNAQINDKVSIHGFGGWAYGKTDGNHYIIGNKDGDYSYSQFSLDIIALLNESITINVQSFWQQDIELSGISLMNFAFVQWKLHQALNIRIGKVKQPFGIYSEIHDVGVLRPFLLLPAAVYGAPGFASKSYNGIGFTGSKYTKNGWGLQYDVYGGEVYLQDILGPIQVYIANHSEAKSLYMTDMTGIRFLLFTPYEGLNFGLSAYRGRMIYPPVNLEGVFMDVSGNYLVNALHIEYLTDTWTIRSEYLHAKQKYNALKLEAAYSEIAYHINENWQIATRYGQSKVHLANFPAFLFNSILKDKNILLGINYWLNSNFVIKSSYQIIEGNRFALPEDLMQSFMESKIKDDTKLLLIGMQFSF